VKLLTGFRSCIDNELQLKTTEDYRLGAVGLPARGFGLVRNSVRV